MDKIVVSGLGVLTIGGISIQDHLELLTSKPEATRERYMDLQIVIDDPGQYINNKKSLRYYGKDTIFACVAAKMALQDAQINEEFMKEHSQDTGLIIGSAYFPTPLDIGEAIAEYVNDDEQIDYEEFGMKGIRKLAHLWMLSRLPNTPAGQISIENGIKGINFSIVNGMNSGMVAIGEALLALQQNRADRVLCGGIEGEIKPEFIIEAERLGLIAADSWCKPFAEGGEGCIFTEGTALLILEKEEANRQRNSRRYAEIIGYSNYYIPQIQSKSIDEIALHFAKCINSALVMAEIENRDVDFIQASFCGYQKLDYAEALALQQIFGNKAYVTAALSYIGYTKAASGAISTAFACMQLKEGFIAPINKTTLFLEDSLNYVRGVPVHQRNEYCIVNAFSYLGEISTLVFRRGDI